MKKRLGNVFKKSILCQESIHLKNPLIFAVVNLWYDIGMPSE